MHPKALAEIVLAQFRAFCSFVPSICRAVASFHCTLDQAYNLVVQVLRDLPRLGAVIGSQ